MILVMINVFYENFAAMGEENQGQYQSWPFYTVLLKIGSCLMVVSFPGFCYPLNNVETSMNVFLVCFVF